MSKEIKTKSNNLFFINSTDEIWRVKEGCANVFLAVNHEKNELGKRYHILKVEKDEVFLPLLKNEIENNFSLVVVPMEDTIFEVIDFKNISIGELCEINKELKEKEIKKWIASLGRKANLLKNDIDNIKKYDSSEEIKIFNKNSINKIIVNIKQTVEQEKKKSKERFDNDWAYFNKGLTGLAETVEKKHKDNSYITMDSEVIKNDLFRACTAVGISKGIDIQVPISLKKNEESSDLLAEIAYVSHIRTREIILKGKWYKESLGSVVAYLGEENRPVALIQVNSNRYKLFDPQTGKTEKVTAKVAEQIQGKAVTFYRSLPMHKLKGKEIIKFVMSGIEKSDIIAVILMGILGGLLGMLMPEITGKVYDSVIPAGERSMLVQIGVLMTAVALTQFIFELTKAYALLRIEGTSEKDLQSAVWDRLLSLPVTFFKDYTSGELAERAMGISEIRKTLSGSVVNTITSFIFSIFYVIMMFRYSIKLALIGLILVFIVMAISLAFGYCQLKYEKSLIDIRNDISGKIFGLLSGLPKIKMAGAEKRAFYNWAEKFTVSRDLAFKKETIGNRSQVFNAGINIIISMVIYFSFIKLKNLNLPAGKFIAFNTAFEKVLASMLSISGIILQINVIIPLYKKIKPIFEAVPEYDEEKNDPGILSGDIEISHINFRYESDGPLVLDDVSMHINKGEYVAIVGPSGSGKSTLFRILLGFEKPENGQIYLDGISIDQLDIRSVRKQFGVVLQTGQLLMGSIFENIIGGNMKLTIDDAWKAAEMAGIAQDIREMPMGMHTMVTEGASTLSGGQRQRLLIARAIANNPKIIFFDEATSALDNRTQQIVSSSIGELDVTRVSIAHRLSTIVDCDRIIVLDKGKVTEEGNYEELMALNGTFAQMARRQLA